MIELNDTIRAVEEFIAPEGPSRPDHPSPTVDGGGSEVKKDVALAESATDSHKTYSFGDFPINVD